MRFDVILFPSGAIPRVGAAPVDSSADDSYTVKDPTAEEMPEQYRSRLGRFTAAKSLPALQAFLEAGGTVVTIGTSANLAYHLRLPVRNALVEIGPDRRERPLSNEKYYIPGSILRATLDPTAPATRGVPAEVDLYFDSSPVFRLAPDAVARGRDREPPAGGEGAAGHGAAVAGEDGDARARRHAPQPQRHVRAAREHDVAAPVPLHPRHVLRGALQAQHQRPVRRVPDLAPTPPAKPRRRRA